MPDSVVLQVNGPVNQLNYITVSLKSEKKKDKYEKRNKNYINLCLEEE